MKSIRLVSELEQISPRTLEWWWYEQKRKQKKAAEEVSRPVSDTVADSSAEPENLHSLSGPPAAPQDRPKPARLDIDSGELRCSRCRGKQIEEREKDVYFCTVCQKSLLFEGFVEEKTSPYYSLGIDTWML